MKKLLSLTLALMLALCALAVPAMAEEAPARKMGMLTMLNVSEEETAGFNLAQILLVAQLQKEGQAAKEGDGVGAAYSGGDHWTKRPTETVYFDSLDAMLMALNVGDIDGMNLYQSTADYLVRNNPGLFVPTDFSSVSENGSEFAKRVLKGFLSNDFAFMFMEDKTALRDEFSAAISAMREDGTLDALAETYIKGVNAGNEPEAIAMPAIEGAETVKVAVTGSLPPMDYVAADGTPAGYNTAVLAEISARINKNIELVQVDSLGRAAALASGTVDAVFWTRTNYSSNKWAEKSEEDRAALGDKVIKGMSEEEIATLDEFYKLVDFSTYGKMDMPEGTIISEPYYSDVLVAVLPITKLEQH